MLCGSFSLHPVGTGAAMHRAGAKELIEATCNNIMGKGPRPAAIGGA